MTFTLPQGWTRGSEGIGVSEGYFVVLTPDIVGDRQMGLVAAAPEEKALSRLSVSYCQMQVNVLNRFAQIGNHLAVSSRTRLHAVRCP